MSTENTSDIKDEVVQKDSSTDKEENVDKKKKKSKKRSKEEVLSEELEEARIQLAEQKDKFLRLFAEFDNYKKRTAKERIELIKTAGQDVVSDMLSVIDDFDRALKATSESNDAEAAKKGFELIREKLISVLGNKGLKAMESRGTEFDADFHEAITEIPAPSEDLKGKVVDVIEKGYTLNDKIIRYAKVVVGK